ncbi:MAG: hypothetical protein JWN34_952 [Bryobacterales bacterium]|jgi:hypothetical protein|nr:hypothetical protein [Bryobacterales bacterium]
MRRSIRTSWPSAAMRFVAKQRRKVAADPDLDAVDAKFPGTTVLGGYPTAAQRGHRACAMPSAQPGCRQLQDNSRLLPASWQYSLQYLLSFGAVQLQAGCAHFLISDIGPNLHR